MEAPFGIGHIRWATHGAVNDVNAHPHTGPEGRVAVVHNGIIDNYRKLKEDWLAGAAFVSETDTEVIAQLAESFLEEDPEEAVKKTLRLLRGTYGLVFLFRDFPGLIIGAKHGSPLVIGIGDGEMFLASDPGAFLGSTRQVVYLDDGDAAVLTPREWRTFNLHARMSVKVTEEYPWEARDTDKGDHPHFFIKEILEQPEAVARAFGHGGRLLADFGTAKFGGLNLESRDLLDVKRVVYFGMGSAHYAGLIGAYQMESLARVPATAEDASELRCRNPLVDRDTLFFAVSQSGETADTLAALREIRHKGGRVLGIVNAVGSAIARAVDGGIYTHSGPEISVTTSKAFSGQVTAVTLLALLFARMRTISLSRGREMVEAIVSLPDKIAEALETREQLQGLAKKYAAHRDFLFLGRGIQYPVALEGALKLKEISYLHAEGYSAGGLKHGPLALVGPDTPCVFLATAGDSFDKIVANMEEVKARKGKILAVTNTDDPRIAGLAEDLIRVPVCDEILSPLLTVVPLQFLAYYIALELGRDVDHPRNLAKSVTTE